MTGQTRSVLLASRSPARARLLAAAGVSVTITPVDVDEGALKAEGLARGHDAGRIATDLAVAKALDLPTDTDALVVGADQTLDLDGRLYDKPASLEEARAHLLSFRGRTHRLHSAAVVAHRGRPVWSGAQTVTLEMRDFSDSFLDGYLAEEGEALLGCVGAYRLEGLGALLFRRIEGDYFAVLGLPLLPLLACLRGRGVLPS